MDRHEAKIDTRFQLFDNNLPDVCADLKGLEKRVEDKLQIFSTD